MYYEKYDSSRRCDLMVSEERFLQDIERLYTKFEEDNPKYVGKNYQSLIFKGSISYKHFIKIHNFKSQIPLPRPNCDCTFHDLSCALEKDNLKGKLLAMEAIDGFQLPMASAVLHFSDPEKYPIIDKNVINAMRKLGWRTRVTMKMNEETIEFYEYYVNKVDILKDQDLVKETAKKFNVTPTRLVETALYSLGKS